MSARFYIAVCFLIGTCYAQQQGNNRMGQGAGAPAFGALLGRFGGQGNGPAGGAGMFGNVMGMAMQRRQQMDAEDEPNPSQGSCSMTFRMEDWCPGDFNKTRLRFFYDAETNKCKPFIGCKPETEGNNYKNITVCAQVCGVNLTEQFANMTRGGFGGFGSFGQGGFGGRPGFPMQQGGQQGNGAGAMGFLGNLRGQQQPAFGYNNANNGRNGFFNNNNNNNGGQRGGN